jgi:Trp operon repressor
VESTYPITTTLLNHQLSLTEAAKRLNQGITTLLRDLDTLKSESYKAFLRSFDRQAYSLLNGKVTKFMTEKIA